MTVKPPTSAADWRGLAPQQRRLLQAFAGAAPEHLPRAVLALAIEGALPREQLHDAAVSLVSRLQILRTRFPRPAELTLPVQSIELEVPPEISWRDNGGSDLVETAWGAPLDIVQGSPLWIGATKTLLIMRLPALCADARTLDLLAQGLANPNSWDPTGLQFADVAEWLREFDADQATEECSWWSRHVHPIPRLPFERANSALATNALHWRAPPELLADIGRQAAALGLREEAIWLAVWWTVVRRLADADVTLAVELDGRSYEGLEHCPGPLARRVPLTWAWDAGMTLRKLAEDVERDLTSGRARQEYFLEPDDAPFAAVGFAWRPGRAIFRGPQTTLRPLLRRVHSGRFALDLCLDRRSRVGEERLDLTLLSNAGRVERAAVDQVRTLLMTAMTVAVANPSTQLRHVPPSSRTTDPSVATAPAARSLLEPVMRTVFNEPNQSAVVDDAGLVTYGQLWHRAGHLASQLGLLGAGPERPVALLAGRSSAAVVGILAAWRCGAPYLALDPALPSARLRGLMAAMPPAAVLVDAEAAAAVPRDGLPVLRCDSVVSPDAPAPCADLAVLAQSCAYILFTSGTTGTPKAVAVEHRQLCAYGEALLRAADLGRGWRFGFASPWAADLGLTMLVGAFTTGGAIHIVPSGCLLHGNAFGGFVNDHKLDCLKIVPSHLETLLNCADPTRVLPRHLLILGGEQPSWRLVQRIAALAPELPVLNHYGPTETTIGVVAGLIDPLEIERLPRPSLGRPLPGLAMYVLDEGLDIVPAWVPGQIYVGGLTVGRGYGRDPAGTAAAYIPDPFSRQPGGRLYATGDRARRHPDGRIEFLGRADRQIKIRGHRVDPAELEAVLQRMPGVARAIVVTRGEPPLGPRLAAYVVLADGAPWDPATLRLGLASELPSYLLPSSMTRIATVPLTASGKLDMARLPPEVTAAPASPLHGRRERDIAALWCEILGLAAVGPDDRFLDLSTSSLALVQLGVALSERLGIDVPIAELFRHPTVRAMAALVGRYQQGNGSAAARDDVGRRRTALVDAGARASNREAIHDHRR